VVLRVDRQAASDGLFEDEESGEEGSAGEEEDAAGEEESGSESDEEMAEEDGGDSDDASDGGLDDEAMFRADGKLAEYFKALRAGKSVRSLVGSKDWGRGSGFGVGVMPLVLLLVAQAWEGELGRGVR